MFRSLLVLFISSLCIIHSASAETPSSNKDAKPELTVYTYRSFVSDWGPGAALKEAFENECQCQLNYKSVDDSVMLLNRLRLAKDGDVVIGFDTNLIAEARKFNLMQPHNLNVSDQLNIEWQEQDFIPYDYGYFSFIYDASKISNPPTSFEELINHPDWTLIYQDPRTSTPGLGLVLWVNAIYGENSESAWKKIANKTVTVTSGWSEAYSLFLKGETDFVLSYNTSPVVHILDNEDKYHSVTFKEGHYQQVEVAGILKTTQNKELAQAFLNFILTPKAQYEIATKNIMYPVTDVRLPEAYDQIEKPEAIKLFKAEEVNKQKSQWIKKWLNAVSR